MISILIIVFLCGFLAFSVSAICGGGAGLMLMPALSRLLPISQMPSALSIGTFTSSASRIIVFRKNICWPIVKYFVPSALPAVWLGAQLLKYVNPIYLEMAMGIFLISHLTFLFKKKKALNETKKPSRTALASIGFLAGFLSGLTGAVGLLFNKFYLRYGLTKEEIVATRAANEITLHLVKLALYFLLGLISTKAISIGLVIALSAVLSAWAMKWALPKISEWSFKKIGYFAMVLSGGLLLSQSSADLFAARRGAIGMNFLTDGIETKLTWQKANYTLEFTYDEGFEFEQVIPFSELTPEQQNKVESKRQKADKIVVEVVYEIGAKSYEAYYFSGDRLIRKIDFE